MGMGVARWREGYISVMILDAGALEYCMLIGASISSKMCAVFFFFSFLKIFCLDWDVFFLSQVALVSIFPEQALFLCVMYVILNPNSRHWFMTSFLQPRP